MNLVWKVGLISACLIVSLAAPLRLSASEPRWIEGTAYLALEPGKRLPANEVVEIFSYACIHCFNFEANMKRVKASLPKGVKVRLIPATFSGSWEPFARSFYAAQALGVAERSHAAAFEYVIGTLHAHGTVRDMASFYAKYGIDPNKFEALANSEKVSKQLAADRKLCVRLGVESTPTLIVGGRYITADVDSYDALENLVYWLEAQAGRKSEAK